MFRQVILGVLAHTTTALWLSGLFVVLVEPATAQPQPRSSRFFPKEYEPYGSRGTSVILGQAYLTLASGERRYCAGQAVFMNPVTTYSFEWYRRNVVGRVELEPADPRSSDYHRVVRSDERGRFRFRDLPAGDYYLGCRVMPDEGFAHAEVRVGEGETVEVVLTRGPGGSGAVAAVDRYRPPAEAPLRDVTLPFGELSPLAPPETIQWGQLAGVWDCSIPIEGPDGARKLAKATWTWRYTIDGHAVRDEYRGHNDAGPDFHGSGLRIYDPEQNAWEVAWVDSNAVGDETPGGMKHYCATYESEQIVMRQVSGDPEWRTIFFDITEDSFEWRNEPSGQYMHCRRIEGSPFRR